MTKCQTHRKFLHLELFQWDLLCNLTLRTFWGGTVKSHPAYMDTLFVKWYFWPFLSFAKMDNKMPGYHARMSIEFEGQIKGAGG